MGKILEKIKRYKKISISILLIVVIFGGVKIFGDSSNEAVSSDFFEQTSVIGIHSFNSSLELNGKTKIKNEQKLSFTEVGRVTNLSFKVGDSVKKGDILAKINSNEAYSEIEKVKINLDNSKTKLDKFIEDLNFSLIKRNALEVSSLESVIRQKKADFEHLQLNQEKELENKQNSLRRFEKEKGLKQEEKKGEFELKKSELENNKIEYENYVKNFQDNLNQKNNEFTVKIGNSYDFLEKSIAETKSRTDKLDEIVGISKTEFNKSNFEIYDTFSSEFPSYKDSAREKFYSGFKKFEDLKENFEKISRDDLEKIIENLELNRDLNEDLYKTSSLIVSGFQNTKISDDEKKIYIKIYSDLSSDISKVKTENLLKIQELKEVGSFENIKISLNKDLLQKKNEFEKKSLSLESFKIDNGFSQNINSFDLKKFENDLDIKKSEIRKTLINQKEDLAQSRISLQKLEIDLDLLYKKRDELKDVSKNQEYISLKNSVKQDKVSLEKAYKNLDKFLIKAPFDGVVTKTEFLVGDSLSLNEKKYISLTDPNTIEVETSINQSDIVKIKKGDLTKIILSAYPEKSFSGAILEIDSTPKEENGVSKFDSKSSLINSENLKLFSGMKALIKLDLQKIPDSLAVPFTAVLSDEKGKYVKVKKEDGTEEIKYVELGFTDGEFYQLISGVEEGEEVFEMNYDSELFKKDGFDNF